MAIAEGIGALKTAFDIGHAINQRVKEGKLTSADIADQLLRLQQLILDSQRALSDAGDEIKALKEQLDTRKRLEEDKLWEPDGNFYRRKSDKEAGRDVAYCPICWETNNQAVPLHPHGVGAFRCALHECTYTTQKFDAHMRKVHEARARRISELNRNINSRMGL